MGKSFIEDIAQRLRIIPNLDRERSSGAKTALKSFPEPEDCLLYTSPSPRD